MVKIESKSTVATWEMAEGTVKIAFDPDAGNVANMYGISYGESDHDEMTSKQIYLDIEYSLTASYWNKEKLYFELYLPVPNYNFMNDVCDPYVDSSGTPRTWWGEDVTSIDDAIYTL